MALRPNPVAMPPAIGPHAAGVKQPKPGGTLEAFRQIAGGFVERYHR